MEFKYIIIDRMKAILFNHSIEHAEEANGRNVTSAGFVQIHIDEAGCLLVKCFGHSQSLNISSNSERDSRVIYKVAQAAMGIEGY